LRICKVKDSPGRNHSTDIVAVRAADCNQSTVMAGQMAHQAISMHRPGSLNRVDAQDNVASRQENPELLQCDGATVSIQSWKSRF
jgi:hypothetical protein